MLWSDVSSTHITNVVVAKNGKGYTLSFDCDGMAGNAVIAVYDKEDPTAADARILWSYHIWVNDRSKADDQKWSVINTTDRTIVKEKYTMMDRNLGATSNVAPAAANSFDNSAYGLFYQWGRKDPFVGAQVYTDSATRKTQYTPTGTLTPTSVTSSAEFGTIKYSVEHPTTFIGEKGNPYNTGRDWLWARNNALWGNPTTSTTPDYYPRSVGSKSVYDPCPEGYCVPPQDAFTMTIKAASFGIGPNGMSAYVSGWNSAPLTYGCNFYYEDTNPVGATVYLPWAGRLDTAEGKVGSAGTDGFYWTNTNLTSGNANAATRAGFNSSTWNPLWGGGRAMGQSVRCMKEKK
ncbi:MAG: hypothetical protein PHD11_07000 [Bacteroidales bacterium]|nr:hypothetical protein [Bacteroidales bacterium]MDD4670610.1 hypothetical protein [Bacteroidales bacterium]